MSRDELVEALWEAAETWGHAEVEQLLMPLIDAYTRERELAAHREICQGWLVGGSSCHSGNWDCPIARRIKEGRDA